MGRYERVREVEKKNDRRIVQADLRKPVVKISPLHYEVGEQTGIAYAWMGWPPLDKRICKFEIDKWLNA